MLNMKNEFIFAPIKTGYGNAEGMVTDRHLEFYRRRAEYLGAVIPEPFYMKKELRELPVQIGIDTDDTLQGLGRLVALLHETDTRAIAHLNHPGRMANPGIPGNRFYSSTDRACENGGAAPARMTADEIGESVALFSQCAVRAQRAGFDGIELQFGHGYLAAQFLSPKVNDRDDEYGGSFENRCRFPLEVFRAVREAVDVPVIVRISGDEMIPGGIRIDEMVEFSKLLADRGAAALHVSAGSICSSPPWYFQHMFVPKGKLWELADRIKAAVPIPVIYVGRISAPEDIDGLRSGKRAEYCAIGRALLADPDFIGKYLGRVKGNIRPCLACAEGCLAGVKSGRGLTCLVNPELGMDAPRVVKAENPGRYAVVGGGLAGMEAALTLKKRGHDVDLFEKTALGGQFNLAPLTPHKRSMGLLLSYYDKELRDSGIVPVMKEVTDSDLVGGYRGVVLATGSIPRVPDIKGLVHYFWADILRDENLPDNKNVLIIGGGLIGVDIATALIPRKNRITIVKRTTDFGEDMEMIAKNLSLKMMEENGTVFSDHTHIRGIDGRTVFAEREGEEIRFDDIDVIVVSAGMQSLNSLEKELKGRLPVYTIGDARKIGNAQDAIADGYRTACALP